MTRQQMLTREIPFGYGGESADPRRRVDGRGRSNLGRERRVGRRGRVRQILQQLPLKKKQTKKLNVSQFFWFQCTALCVFAQPSFCVIAAG